MIDPATYFDIASFPWVDGDDAQRHAKRSRRGGVIILPEQQAIKLDVERGDTVHVRTTQGVKPFTLDRHLRPDRQLLRARRSSIKDAALFGAGRPNAFLAVGQATASTATRLRDHDPSRRCGRSTTSRSRPATTSRKQAHAQLQGFFGLAYALLFVAALVGILGLANTMVVSVLSRTREVGDAAVGRARCAARPGPWCWSRRRRWRWSPT